MAIFEIMSPIRGEIYDKPVVEHETGRKFKHLEIVPKGTLISMDKRAKGLSSLLEKKAIREIDEQELEARKNLAVIESKRAEAMKEEPGKEETDEDVDEDLKKHMGG